MPARLIAAAIVLGALFAALLAPAPASAGRTAKCVPTPMALWGDGRHDDTKALNAWFEGADVVWAQSGEKIGAEISGRVFKLSAAVFIPSGTNRRLDRFELVWPTHGERVTGGTLATGPDRNAAPIATGISKTGGDPGEGIALPASVPRPQPSAAAATGCEVS
jgi:hypothetical protein